MLREPPALHDQGVSAFLAYEHDSHALLQPIDIEEHSVPAKEPQLALGHRIRAERLHVPRLNQRIRFESPRRLLQHRSTRLPAKGPQVVDDRFLEQYPPARHVPRLYRTRILVKLSVGALPGPPFE